MSYHESLAIVLFVHLGMRMCWLYRPFILHSHLIHCYYENIDHSCFNLLKGLYPLDASNNLAVMDVKSIKVMRS